MEQLSSDSFLLLRKQKNSISINQQILKLGRNEKNQAKTWSF